jgi:hypothetical protein
MDLVYWIFPAYLIVGMILGFVLGSFCITFGGESNHVLVWILAWPIKLIIVICHLVESNKR